MKTESNKTCFFNLKKMSTNKHSPSPEHPHIISTKVRSNVPPQSNKSILSPLCISRRVPINAVQLGEKVQDLTKKISRKKVLINIMVFGKNDCELEIANHTSTSLILGLGESPGTSYKIAHDGNITFDQLIEIARMKESKKGRSFSGRVKEVLGTCVSIGCKVNGEDPRVIQNQITNGTCLYLIPDK